MKRALAWSALAAVLASFAAPAAAQDTPKDEDVTFVMTAASAGMWEVQSSQLAAEQAKSDAVKAFARRMVEDHTKANKELMDVAAKKNVKLPAGLTKKHADMLAAVANAKQDFDAQYAKAQAAAHEEAVALFEREAKDGKDADLKAFAEKNLPTLKDHLKMAQDLAKGVK